MELDVEDQQWRGARRALVARLGLGDAKETKKRTQTSDNAHLGLCQLIIAVTDGRRTSRII